MLTGRGATTRAQPAADQGAASAGETRAASPDLQAPYAIGRDGARPIASPPGDVGRVCAALALILLVGLTFLVVMIAASRPNFFVSGSASAPRASWLRGPLARLWQPLHPSPVALRYLISGLLAAMFGCYLAIARWARRLRPHWTLAAVAALTVILLLGPPIGSSDVFNYIDYGRMAAVDHLNPYTTIPLRAPHDGLSFALSNWHGLLSPYGPLFTQLTEALAPLGVRASLWALKLLDAGAYIALMALVWHCARRLGRSPTEAVAFVGLNPLTLVWALGGVHYDVIVMALAVGAVYLCARAQTPSARDSGRLELPAGAAFGLAVALKASALMLTPMFVLSGRPRRFLLGLVAAGIALALASVASFGLHGPALSAQAHLINTHDPANIAGYLLGLGGENHALHVGLNLAAVLTFLACSGWVWHSPDDWLTAAGTLTLVVVVTLSWSVPWYVLWILPFAALSRSGRLRTATLVVSLCFLLLFMPAEPLVAAKIGFHPESTAIGRAGGRAVKALGG
jgi:hypothetical protein